MRDCDTISFCTPILFPLFQERVRNSARALDFRQSLGKDGFKHLRAERIPSFRMIVPSGNGILKKSDDSKTIENGIGKSVTNKDGSTAGLFVQLFFCISLASSAPSVNNQLTFMRFSHPAFFLSSSLGLKWYLH